MNSAVALEESGLTHVISQPDQPQDGHQVDYLARFKYPGIALGLSIVIMPMELTLGPPLVGIAIIKASIPRWRRTFKNIRKTGRPDADVLESLWILFHTITGEMLAPALSLVLVEASSTLRDLTAMVGERKTPELIPNRSYWIERDGRRRKVMIKHLMLGDHIILSSGDWIPGDGKVVLGEGLVDQGTLTGSSNFLTVSTHKKVFASTILIHGQITVKLTKLGGDTKAAKMLSEELDNEPEDTRISDYMEELGNKAVVPALLASTAIFVVTGNTSQSLAPLQLDFAQGVGIGSPIPVITTIQQAATKGRVLIKGGHALEHLANLDAVIFDKTGTLTQTSSKIEAVHSFNESITEQAILFLAASASYYSLHPFSSALQEFALETGVTSEATDPIDSSDTGVMATINEQTIIVGTSHYLKEKGVVIDTDYHRKHKSVIRDRSIRYVAIQGVIVGSISYTNPLRPESAMAISKLNRMGVACYLFTGDNSRAANAVAYKLGFKPSNTYSDLASKDKVKLIDALKNTHKTIAYVGDGINDSAALRHADVGISFADASHLAVECADVVLLDNSLLGIGYVAELSKRSMSLVHQNIVIVTAANFASIAGSLLLSFSPLAAVMVNNGATLYAGLNGLRPLQYGDRHDPDIDRNLIRGDKTLLGIPWRKRKRRSLRALLERPSNEGESP
jgi:heavy metal translocating P-type ATPase